MFVCTPISGVPETSEEQLRVVPARRALLQGRGKILLLLLLLLFLLHLLR
jgi:hypothetical protein